jgi:hypothetical protein
MNDVVTNLPATVHAPSHAGMTFDEMRRLAQSVAKSGLFGIKTEDQALSLMALAQAEGRHPATVARDYHIINGTPSKKAEAMARDFLSSGGKIEWHALDDTVAEATFSHPIGGAVRLRWDQARVVQAQLSGGMHKKYPRQMLRSRLISEGVRTVWPMATSGMYEPGEVTDFSPSRAEPIDVTPKDDIDAFAGETIDAETGEIIDLVVKTMAAVGDAAADNGRDAFLAWWNDPNTKPHWDKLRPSLERWRVIATAADQRGGPAPEESADENPFGLPPSGAAEKAPAATSTESSPGPSDTGDTPAGEPAQPGLALGGDAPTENLIVPYDPQKPAYFARQMKVMIDEYPADFARTARIKLANKASIDKLKAADSAAYDALQLALNVR